MNQKINYTVTRSVPEDARGIADLELQCFSSPWSYAQVLEEINRDNVIFLSAKNEDEILGYISGQLIAGEFYISNVAVSPLYRKHGIGYKLIEALLEQLKNISCAFATLEVRASNYDARRLYEKFGFINLGVRKNFYSSPTEDANIYTLYFTEDEV